MLNSRIRDYKAETEAIYEKLAQVVRTDSPEDADELQRIAEAIERSEPSLMFYGIYNAGKSSLLNAVFGEEKASVGDIPQTHKVTAYQWGRYTLVDTPGLDGPPEDEKITAAEVRQHDIILFVIDDSDNFDSDVITKKIIEILETGKPCMIVINRKNDSDKGRILAIKAKMKQNIQKLSSVVQNYEFVDVDAVSALKAKREGKQGLLADSNIKELEYCISNRLASLDSVQILRIPLENMVRLCGKLQKDLENELSSGESQKLNQLKRELFQSKESIRREFSIALGSAVDGYAERIYQDASAGRETDPGEKVYEQEIQKLAQEYMEKFSSDSRMTLQQFTQACRMNLSLPDIPEKQRLEKFPAITAESEDVVDSLLDILEKIPVLVPAPIPVPIPLPLIAGVVRTFKKFIFGKGSTNLPDIDELNRQQEEYAQERAMALRELRNQIFIQMEDFKSHAEGAFLEQLESACQARMVNIDRALKEQDEKNADCSRRLELAAGLLSRAAELLEDIGKG